MSFAELLTQEQVKRVHEASLEILENVGLKVRYAPARELFAQHGAKTEIVAPEFNPGHIAKAHRGTIRA